MYLRLALALFVAVVAACGDAATTVPPAPTTTVAPATTAIPTTTVAPTTVAATTTAPTTTAAPTSTAAEPACSTAGVRVQPTGDLAGLPGPVVETRAAILDLALACDYDGLAELALAGEPFFSFSFGGGDDPAEFWREAEAAGDPALLRLVQVLNLSYGYLEEADIYVWPAVAAQQFPTDADYEEVRSIYDDDAIALFQEFGGYIGYRAGIRGDGDWLSFVAGD